MPSQGDPAHWLPQASQAHAIPVRPLGFKTALEGEAVMQPAPPALLPVLAAWCFSESVEMSKNMQLNKRV